MSRRCPRCLLSQGQSYFQIRGFAPYPLLEELKVPARGPCSLCRAYLKAFDAARVADELKLFGVMMGRTGASDLGGIVSVSGGKDSLSTLYLAKARMKWKVAAFLFDNGFIPKPVVDQTRALCERLNVPLYVERFDKPTQKAFAKRVDSVTPTGATPCDACAYGMYDALAALGERLGTRNVITGTNFYATWGRYPSALAVRTQPGDKPFTYLNLPYALGVTSTQARQNVKKLGAQVIDMKGVSTNCRVPELVQKRIGRKLGHVPELEVLSLEVMVGHMPRSEALKTLRKKAPSLAV